jgi:hypothetical protein
VRRRSLGRRSPGPRPDTCFSAALSRAAAAQARRRLATCPRTSPPTPRRTLTRARLHAGGRLALPAPRGLSPPVCASGFAAACSCRSWRAS